MATRFIQTTTFDYVAATHTVTSNVGGGPATFFYGADVGGVFLFWSNTATELWHGRIKKVVSGTTCVLEENPNTLPSVNKSWYAGAVVKPQGRLYADYISRIQTFLQDDRNMLTDAQMRELLTAAVTDYGEDAPMKAKIRWLGDGTASYLLWDMLGAQWQAGYTVIHEVEYPAGETPPTILEKDEWEVYDDGSTQDGTNVLLRFLQATPAAGEWFVVTYRLRPEVPDIGMSTQLDTDSHVQNICLLTTAYCCFALAVRHAQTTDSTMAGDTFNLQSISDRYRQLGRMWLQRYNASVFGEEEPKGTAASASVQMKIETRASDRGNFLFH